MIVVMKLIRIFSRIDELASSVGEKSGIKLILRTMQRYPFCVQLQINCSACLANLASTKANLTAMLEEGCIKLVLENMNKFMNIPDVQAEICATIANLAVHDANARYIIDQGGCVLIIKAMRIHINQIDFQIQAFHALASLGKFGKEILDREHFMHAATKCLLAHSGNLDLISAAYHSIGSLANAGISIGSYKFELISGIFDSMKRFKDNCVFQVTACFALAHIFFNHRDPEQDDLAVAKKEGIQCILGIMKTFSDQESLQTTALFALGSIVMKSELHRNTVLESDGISIILNSMSRKYTSTPALDNDGLLIAEAAFEDELEAEIAPQAAEPVLFSRTNARVKCSKPLLLQLFGSVSLLNLAETEKCRDAIIEQGGIHAIFEASKKVHDQADLWFIVYYIFSKFTRCGGNQY